MKVKIGEYPSHFGPYQLAEALCFWAKKVPDEYGMLDKPKWVHKFGDFLAYGRNADRATTLAFDDDRDRTWLAKLLSKLNRQHRQVQVRIDPSDTWSMDSTLALIIHPMLVQLNEKKHGAPYVEDADVPEELRSTAAPPKEHDYDVDENHFKRWDWVMSEMIWAFSQYVENDGDWESQYHTGKHDIRMKPVDDAGNEVPREEAKLFEMVRGPKDTHVFDKAGYEKHQARMRRGFMLFGKYYQGLWD